MRFIGHVLFSGDLFFSEYSIPDGYGHRVFLLPKSERGRTYMANFNDKTYRLVDVLDGQGNRRAETDHRYQDFYKSLVGCIAQNIRESICFYSGARIMRIDIVQDPAGIWINRNFKTSPLREIKEKEDGGLEIVTMNSVYIFAPAALKEPVYQDEANIIELYLCDSNSQFAAGFFYDENKHTHPLVAYYHSGMVVDSVLIDLKDAPGKTVCRYFPRGIRITFYDTIYGQQDYSRRLLIHNTGEISLEIEFEHFEATWTIHPGESKMITPYCDDGADDEHENRSDDE